RSGDPSAHMARDEGANATLPPTRVEDGVAIASCSTLATAANMPAALAELAQAPRGTVLDCRDFASYPQAQAFVSALAQSRPDVGLPGGATMVRTYSGFPPELGTSSGQYTTGLSLLAEPAVAPGDASPVRTPLAIIVDAWMSPFLPTLAALQAAGKARI